MADQSDLTRALFLALPATGDTLDWEGAPIIDCWSLFASPNEREVAVVGVVSGSDKFNNRSSIRTSALRAVDPGRRFAQSQNSIYRLGWPDRISLRADADHVWPPALAIAARANWHRAIEAAIGFTGRHSLAEALWNDLFAAAHDDGDWPERQAACAAIAKTLRKAGRSAVAEAWTLLESNLKARRYRKIATRFVVSAGEEAEREYERDLTADETLAVRGWRLLNSMDDAQFEKLPREGVPTDDAIAAAHKIASIAVRDSGKRDHLVPAGSVLDDVFVADSEAEANDPPGPDGVIVLREVGGVDTNWSGREVKRAVSTILGKRLPLAPAPDTAAMRKALAAEFPHAQATIDVLLSDLVGARFACFRASALVGPAGCAKSRLARRVAETAGLYVHHYDGSGASDNAWGGTARRWSTGEPAVPVMAMIAAKSASALVLIDELDKAANAGNNGRLWDALLPCLDTETSKRLADPFIESTVDCSYLSYIATANDERLVPGPLRDRFRILRIPAPTSEHLRALCRGIVADFARESGSDPLWLPSGSDRPWFPDLSDDELYIAAKLWRGGSIRRLRDIVARIIVRRAEMPRH